jgi:hypothetical protein
MWSMSVNEWQSRETVISWEAEAIVGDDSSLRRLTACCSELQDV